MLVLELSRGIRNLRGEKPTQGNKCTCLCNKCLGIVCLCLFPPPGRREFRETGLRCDKAFWHFLYLIYGERAPSSFPSSLVVGSYRVSHWLCAGGMWRHCGLPLYPFVRGALPALHPVGGTTQRCLLTCVSGDFLLYP